MKSTNFNIFIICIFSTLFISACATRLDTLSPAAIDLSGQWLLNKQASQTVTLSTGRNPNQQSGGMTGGMSSGGMTGGMGGNQQGPDSVSNVGRSERGLTPAMKSIEMTIEQNQDSMGIAYPGEVYRDIDWGKKEFYRETVNAGWQDNDLIVISASDQMTLTETYQLNPAQNVLTLTISIESQRGNNQFVRVFNLQQ